MGKTIRKSSWSKKCRLTGRNRKIVCRQVSDDELGRWLRDKEVEAIVNDTDKQSPSRSAA